MLPLGDVFRIVGIDLAVRQRLAAEGGGVRAVLGGHRVRGRLARGRVLLPGQSRLVIEMNPRHVGPQAIDHSPAHDAHRSAAGDVRVRPIALGSQVHLVPPAHDAIGHEIHAGADQVGFVVGRVMAVEQVETETVLALEQLIRALCSTPIDQAKTALAQMAEHFDLCRGAGLFQRGFHRVRAGPQQPTVDVAVFGAARLGALNRHGGDGERCRQATAVPAGQRQDQRRRGQPLGRAANHRDVDLFVGLKRSSALGPDKVEFGPAACRGSKAATDHKRCDPAMS